MAGLNVVLSNLKKWENMKKAGLEGLARTAGAGMQGYARDNAKWINRTGDARRGLRGGMYKEGQDIFAYIKHSMEYGIYLELKGSKIKTAMSFLSGAQYMELAEDGKYAILGPTRDKFAPEVYKQADRLMKL
jgi:gamma-glutamylcysteine synthetase